jgi:Tol biopolymer transport system component
MFRFLYRTINLFVLVALLGACSAVVTPTSPESASPLATSIRFTATAIPPTSTPLLPTLTPAPSATPTPDLHSLSGPYLGQVPPDLSPQVFAPGFVSLNNSNEYSAAFSPDGSEFYFTRQFTGYQDIYETHLVDGIWSEPAPVAFTARYGAHEPHITFDNTTLYFGWFRPVPAGESSDMDYGIWAVNRMADGWSDPRYVGQGMYVTSDRSGHVYVTDLSAPQANISLVTLTEGRFTTWEALNAGAHPCIAPDGSYLIYDRDYGEYLYVRFRLEDGTWGEAIDLTGQGIPREAGIASISPDGLYLFYTDGHDIYWVSTEIITVLK